jgi:CheY-like chemotaxis protein
MSWLLVIADTKHTLDELQHQLHQIQTHVHVRCETALSALSLLDSLDPPHLPTCILIDIDQGNIPGMAVIHSIRGRIPLMTLPMVALLPLHPDPQTFTTIIQQAFKDQCLVLHHPIARSSLQQVINKLKLSQTC